MKKLKILIANDGYHAHYFERMAWINAFNSIASIEAKMYNVKDPAFRVFDEFEPDIFIGQLYNLDRATVKCIKNRPHLQVALRAGDCGDFKTDPRFNILQTSEAEFKAVEELHRTTGQPNFVYIHYEQDQANMTHSRFIQAGIPVAGIMLCADVHSYLGGSYDPSLECDIGFVGGYWSYKAQTINRYLLPLCYPVNKYNIKIFGNQGWTGVNQYCGHINENKVKDLFVSAKICPNLSEPHAHEYGIEINERSFKVLAAGGFCIGDNVASHKRIFQDGMVFADNEEDFKQKIDYFLQNRDQANIISKTGQAIVLKNHTNYHRAAQFLSLFGYKDLSETILSSWNKYYDENLS
jgi:hypothetical protein